MFIPKAALEPAPIEQAYIAPSDLKIIAVPFVADIALEICGLPNRRLSNTHQLRFGSKGSLSIDLRAATAGKWHNHETGEGGSILDLIMCQLGYDFPAAYDWLLRRLGFGDHAPKSDAILRMREEQAFQAVAQETVQAARQAKQLSKAQGIWEASTCPEGTLVETYLRNRACWLPSLANGSAIRFNEACPMDDGGNYPAMVAAMTDATTGLFTGVHRTHLLPDGSGKGMREKRMIGRAKGAVIRLFGGGGRTCFAEGIETTLTACLTEQYQAAVCVCHMGNFFACAAVPRTTEAVIYSDNATPNPKPGASDPIYAACFYAARCEAAGQQFCVISPPSQYSDMNDWAWQKPVEHT